LQHQAIQNTKISKQQGGYKHEQQQYKQQQNQRARSKGGNGAVQI
jgi:flagellar hook-length control protein FliK